MNKIGEDIKAYIVEGLASYKTPSEMVEAVKLEFGTEVSRQQVAAYDPTKAQGKRLSAELSEMFHMKRKSYNRDLSGIALSSVAYRLEQLTSMMQYALLKKNMPLAASLIEQAAKEMGGIYINGNKLQQYSSGDDDDNNDDGLNLENMSDEDLKAILEIIERSGQNKAGTSPP